MSKQNVTPEYLLSHGFVQYNTSEEGDCCDIPFIEGYLHFRQIEFSRQLFVVLLSQRDDNDISQGYDDTVYVQIDAGCGFIEMPFPWVDLPIEYFESVYYGIQGEKPKFNPAAFQDTEYEIVKPKQLK